MKSFAFVFDRKVNTLAGFSGNCARFYKIRNRSTQAPIENSHKTLKRALVFVASDDESVDFTRKERSLRGRVGVVYACRLSLRFGHPVPPYLVYIKRLAEQPRIYAVNFAELNGADRAFDGVQDPVDESGGFSRAELFTELDGFVDDDGNRNIREVFHLVDRHP